MLRGAGGAQPRAPQREAGPERELTRNRTWGSLLLHWCALHVAAVAVEIGDLHVVGVEGAADLRMEGPSEFKTAVGGRGVVRV